MISKQCKSRADVTLNLQPPFTIGISCSLVKLNSWTIQRRIYHSQFIRTDALYEETGDFNTINTSFKGSLSLFFQCFKHDTQTHTLIHSIYMQLGMHKQVLTSISTMKHHLKNQAHVFSNGFHRHVYRRLIKPKARICYSYIYMTNLESFLRNKHT